MRAEEKPLTLVAYEKIHSLTREAEVYLFGLYKGLEEIQKLLARRDRLFSNTVTALFLGIATLGLAMVLTSAPSDLEKFSSAESRTILLLVFILVMLGILGISFLVSRMPYRSQIQHARQSIDQLYEKAARMRDVENFARALQCLGYLPHSPISCLPTKIRRALEPFLDET